MTELWRSGDDVIALPAVDEGGDYRVHPDAMAELLRRAGFAPDTTTTPAGRTRPAPQPDGTERITGL